MTAKKTTTELLNEIKESSDPEEFFERNTDEMKDMSLSAFFNEMLSFLTFTILKKYFTIFSYRTIPFWPWSES